MHKITKIKDGRVICSDKEKIKNVYIYEITPIQILTLTNDVQNRILSVYKEFLKEISFDFQIIYVNKKLSEDECEEIFKNSDNSLVTRNLNFLNRYKKEVKSSLIQNEVCINKFYIVVTYNGAVEYVDRILKKLTKIGCDVKRVIEDRELKNILYKCFNKCY